MKEVPRKNVRSNYSRLLESRDWAKRLSSTLCSRPRSRTTPTTSAVTRSRLTAPSRSKSPRPSWKRNSSKVSFFFVFLCFGEGGDDFAVNLFPPVRLTVIDTPGFGDYVNNRDSWQPIVEFLDDQHESYMLQEQQPHRQDKIDMRVHACLYFIRPTGHTLKPLDIEVMKRLSTRVNLIPVVAKADTLSPSDLIKFKRRVSNLTPLPKKTI